MMVICNLRSISHYLFKYDLGFGLKDTRHVGGIIGNKLQAAKYITSYLALLTLLIISIPADAQNITAITTFHDCPDCPEMVPISPGTFIMGSSKEEANKFQQNANLFNRLAPTSLMRAQPQHTVVISHAFAIGKYTVTRSDFAKFIRETGYRTTPHCTSRVGRPAMPNFRAWNHGSFEQEGSDPIVCVTWADANAYIAWLNNKIKSTHRTAKSGLYRLPSEAEYEYAARGGTTTKRWWGDDIGRNKAVCGECGSPWDRQQPAPVGLYDANPYGVSDILGNVWEWTQDCWNKNYEQAPIDGSPWLTGECALRVMRGGSWESEALAVRSEVRSHADQDSGDFDLGFRVVKSLQ